MKHFLALVGILLASAGLATDQRQRVLLDLPSPWMNRGPWPMEYVWVDKLVDRLIRMDPISDRVCHGAAPIREELYMFVSGVGSNDLTAPIGKFHIHDRRRALQLALVHYGNSFVDNIDQRHELSLAREASTIGLSIPSGNLISDGDRRIDGWLKIVRALSHKDQSGTIEELKMIARENVRGIRHIGYIALVNIGTIQIESKKYNDAQKTLATLMEDWPEFWNSKGIRWQGFAYLMGVHPDRPWSPFYTVPPALQPGTSKGR